MSATIAAKPAKLAKITPAAPEMERVTDASLFDYWPALYPDLKERGFGLPERETLNWIRGVLLSNEYLFIRRGDVLALALRATWALEPPHVRVIFVSGPKEVADSVGALLILDIVRWATALGAAKVVLEPTVETDRKEIMKHIELRERPEVFHRIAKGGGRA